MREVKQTSSTKKMSQKRTFAQTFGNSRSKTVHSTQNGLLPAQKILRNARSKQVRKENIIASNQSSKLQNPYFNQIQSKSRIILRELFAQFEYVFRVLWAPSCLLEGNLDLSSFI